LTTTRSRVGAVQHHGARGPRLRPAAPANGGRTLVNWPCAAPAHGRGLSGGYWTLTPIEIVDPGATW
jgi:hypothetical protein